MQLRRLYAAPDDPHELIATCAEALVPYGRYCPKTGSVVFTDVHAEGGSQAGAAAAAAAATEDEEGGGSVVRLPFPATDLSWCPAKKGAENASFLTACNSQPLQLWDAEDGELRASYVAANDSGNHTHPRCCGWLAGPGAAAPLLVMGGYGGHEDKSPVRFFDVLREGSQAVYSYDSSFGAGAASSNNVVAAVAAGPRGFEGLALAGYRNHATVDVIDVRHRCPAAVLRGGRVGQHGCVRTIRTHPTREHLVFAGGARDSSGDDVVLCWDLRRPSEAVAAYSRGPAPTHQALDFVVAAPAAGGADLGRLVSACGTGGLRVFDLCGSSDGAVKKEAPPVLAAELGVTSGLALLETSDDALTVAVVVGARRHTFTARAKRTRPESSSSPAAAKRDEEKAPGAEDSDGDDVDCVWGGRYLRNYRKGLTTKAAVPLSDSEEEGEETAATCGAAGQSNVVVAKVPLLK